VHSRLPPDCEHSALGPDEAAVSSCGPVAGHRKTLSRPSLTPLWPSLSRIVAIPQVGRVVGWELLSPCDAECIAPDPGGRLGIDSDGR
jgi:hypothetical protein